MTGFEPKKLALLRILQILQEETDADHPLTQAEIAEILNNRYGIVIERKAIGYNLSLLKEAGYEIESDRRRGSFIAVREFDDMEIRVLIDAVLNSRHISEKYSKDLIGKLAKLAGPEFNAALKHVRTTQKDYKTNNKQLFLNIETIDRAIEMKCQISYDFHYYKYSWFQEKLRYPCHTYTSVSPYELILHNQRYYMKAFRNGNMTFDKLDQITNVRCLDDVPAISIEEADPYNAYQNADFQMLLTLTPFMLFKKHERIELLMQSDMIGELIDWFGSDCTILKADEMDEIKVNIVAEPRAMMQWALLHCRDVEILSPESVRRTFCYMLKRAVKKYRLD